MTYIDAAKRALATFVFGATGALVAAPLLDVDTLELAAAAGVSAVINFAYRTAQAYLQSKGEPA